MSVRILLADDLSFMRMVQKEILEERGYNVIGEAADGLEAIEKYKSLRPEVIILDITMPNMNGLDAMYKIFEMDKTAKMMDTQLSEHEDGEAWKKGNQNEDENLHQ